MNTLQDLILEEAKLEKASKKLQRLKNHSIKKYLFEFLHRHLKCGRDDDFIVSSYLLADGKLTVQTILKGKKVEVVIPAEEIELRPLGDVFDNTFTKLLTRRGCANEQTEE